MSDNQEKLNSATKLSKKAAPHQWNYALRSEVRPARVIVHSLSAFEGLLRSKLTRIKGGHAVTTSFAVRPIAA